MRNRLFLIIFITLVEAVFGQSSYSFGTGFFINDNGIIITCAHVVKGADRITVKINNTEFLAEVLAKNIDTGLAALRINYRNPYHFKITNFDTVNLEDNLFVLGYPSHGDISYTEGSVLATSGEHFLPAFFKHNASTNPGNSGGPILNNNFEVVGAAFAAISNASSAIWRDLNEHYINFGVKSRSIYDLLADIIPGPGNVLSINNAKRATVQILSYLGVPNPLLTEIPNIWPILGDIGRITMHFGLNIHPITGREYFHGGIDITTFRFGDPIIATADGQVVYVGFHIPFGNNIIIRHRYGFFTRYAHMRSFRVQVGQHVQQGDIIGYIGNTGISTGPHLHYEVHIGAEVVNPLKHINIQE